MFPPPDPFVTLSADVFHSPIEEPLASTPPRLAGGNETPFGRPPDMLPKQGEAVWHVTTFGSVYLTADPARAGSALITMAVSDLDQQRHVCARRARAVTGRARSGFERSATAHHHPRRRQLHQVLRCTPHSRRSSVALRGRAVAARPSSSTGIPNSPIRRRCRRPTSGSGCRGARIMAFTLRGRCSECVRGRLPLPEALRDELGALLLAPAVQHLEV